MPASNSARRTKPTRRPHGRPGPAAKGLTELDFSILGVVWRDGPVTAYQVRRRFATSVTAVWSASTGSIYPAIRRLVARGLLRASAHRDGRRTRELSISTRGTAVFRAWLRHVNVGLAANVADPVRTRVQFLAALTPREAARFLADAEADCSSALRNVESVMAGERGAGRHRTWALTGARHELEARLRWIRWIRRRAARAGE
jgi:DNA-binding PadR family transcriptional regulator